MRTAFELSWPWAALAALVGACAAAPQATADVDPPPPVVAAPAGCRTVTAADALQVELDRARPGEALCLTDGRYRGAIVVPPGVTVFGSSRAVIETAGQGTTVLLSSGAKLLGVTVDGSGGRFDVLDAAVKVHGDDVTIASVTVKNSAFGVLLEKSRRATVRDNHVYGTGAEALGLRGDGIRLWETHDSTVTGNRVRGARDCVVWYSSHNVLEGNDVRHGRYGVHLMYSHFNRIAQNHFVANEVGIFAMYSRNLVIEDNTLLLSGGAAGIGLGVKESGNLTVVRNQLAHNTQGFFLDNSPLNPGDQNLFEDNVVRLSDVGVGFLSSQHDNVFRHNAFRDNTAQVRVDGGGDALGVEWDQNEWSDYAGYDLDGDGLGDLPYQLDDLKEALVARHADLTFLRGTLALAMVSVAGEVVPLFAPKPVLRDLHPRFRSRSDDAN